MLAVDPSPPLAATPRPSIGRLAFVAVVVGIACCIHLFRYGTGLEVSPFVWLACLVIPAAARLANMGSRPLYGLLIAIPFFGVVVLIACLTFPPGYEEPQGKLDEAGKTVGCFFIGMIVLTVSAVLYLLFYSMFRG